MQMSVLRSYSGDRDGDESHPGPPKMHARPYSIHSKTVNSLCSPCIFIRIEIKSKKIKDQISVGSCMKEEIFDI